MGHSLRQEGGGGEENGELGENPAPEKGQDILEVKICTSDRNQTSASFNIGDRCT